MPAPIAVEITEPACAAPQLPGSGLNDRAAFAFETQPDTAKCAAGALAFLGSEDQGRTWIPQQNLRSLAPFVTRNPAIHLPRDQSVYSAQRQLALADRAQAEGPVLAAAQVN